MKKINKGLALKSIILAICLVSCLVSVAAASTVSMAELDWSGLSYTVSGGLTINSTYWGGGFSNSWVSTSYDSDPNSHYEYNQETRYDFDTSNWRYTNASSNYTSSNGEASAQTSASDGILRSYAQADTTTQNWSDNYTKASTDIMSVFWLYGSGVGEITMTVPYRLFVYSAPDFNDITFNCASVAISIGPGFGWNDSDMLKWVGSTDGTLTQSGVLSVSSEFNNPYWGPLVCMTARADAVARESVPEPSMLLLLGGGLLGLAGARRKFKN